MKNALKFLGIMMITLFVFTSCSKDDDPADNDLFVGTYKGPISFRSAEENKSTENGSVTVAKVGNSYNFAFSDGIKDIGNVQFEKENENTYINVGGDATNYIRITANKLTMLYIKDGETWTADCTR